MKTAEIIALEAQLFKLKNPGVHYVIKDEEIIFIREGRKPGQMSMPNCAPSWGRNDEASLDLVIEYGMNFQSLNDRAVATKSVPNFLHASEELNFTVTELYPESLACDITHVPRTVRKQALMLAVLGLAVRLEEMAASLQNAAKQA